MSTDNAKEPETQAHFVVPEPTLTQEQQDAHDAEELKRKARGQRLITAWTIKLNSLVALSGSDVTVDTPVHSETAESN